jgi:hypothetical protein
MTSPGCITRRATGYSCGPLWGSARRLVLAATAGRRGADWRCPDVRGAGRSWASTPPIPRGRGWQGRAAARPRVQVRAGGDASSSEGRAGGRSSPRSVEADRRQGPGRSTVGGEVRAHRGGRRAALWAPGDPRRPRSWVGSPTGLRGWGRQLRELRTADGERRGGPPRRCSGAVAAWGSGAPRARLGARGSGDTGVDADSQRRTDGSGPVTPR